MGRFHPATGQTPADRLGRLHVIRWHGLPYIFLTLTAFAGEEVTIP